MARAPIVMSSGYSEYTLGTLLGEGGAGRVYAATASDGSEVAIKILLHGATTEKKKRFRNELRFLERNEHPNIVSVSDRGNSPDEKLNGPFYVMQRFDGSLRKLIDKKIAPEDVMPLFLQVLDGVESAHLKGVVHRDLKPENVLYRGSPIRLAVADFGCAQFALDEQATAVETREGQRLANFRYSAPEQRTPSSKVDKAADIYALGLILNEMFTGNLAQGVDYPTIAEASPQHAYLDAVVQQCLSHAPSARPSSIGEVKAMIRRLGDLQVSEQKVSALSGQVVNVEEIDDPLAEEPPQLVDYAYDFDTGRLQLILNREVNPGWITALQNMGNYTSVLGRGPESFHWSKNVATVPARDDQIQSIIDYFKPWLPVATRVYKSRLSDQAAQAAAEREAAIKRERDLEQRKASLLKSIKI